jgi:spore maturation protein CgeB
MKDLKPYVHYIPVKADLSDLEEQYQWAEEHPQEAKQIAANALEYAQKNLTSKVAILKYSEILEDYLFRNKQPQESPQ